MKSKAHQEDKEQERSKEKKCKGKRSAAEYKFAIEYSFAVEYSSLTKWLRQMKINWAQDPFDPVNIICPTKAQILLYKR